MIDNNEQDGTASYLQQAADACAAGDPALGMHLYLAAFEQSQQASDSKTPSPEAVNGLKKAWALACKLKERPIAEYVFERIAPYLTSEEATVYAKQLQDLAIDKLEQFGIPRDSIEGLADMISQDFAEDGSARPQVQVRHIGAAAHPKKSPAAKGDGPEVVEVSIDPSTQPPKAPAAEGAPRQISISPAKAPAKGGSSAQPAKAPAEFGSYDQLVGFDVAVARMRELGIGMDDDPQFQEFVSLLNDRHGLEAKPAVDSLLFRSPAREDANRFMMATAGELGLPVLRMRMEENLQGMLILCVMAQSDRQPKLNAARTRFEGPGVLLIEDLDLWVSPVSDQPADDLNGFIMASLSRGAREAVTLIRSAVNDSEVYVLASASASAEVDPFFCELLAPLTAVDIDYPTDAERAAIWKDIVHEHPSLRGIDREALVRYSRLMPRYDIYSAVREAIDEAYRSSLASRRYTPVGADNLFDKLAAYQPIDSEEYRALEDAVVEGFRRELDDIDRLLGGQGD